MSIFDFIFPEQCFGCGRYANFICNNCEADIKPMQYQRCIVCQKSSLFGFTHPKCKSRLKPDRLISIFEYNDRIINKIINSAKYNFISEAFINLASLACTKLEIHSHTLKRFTVCCIPTTRWKQNFRGFNQSMIISKIISKHLELPIDNLLQKTKSTKQQKHLDKADRFNNLSNAFTLKSKQSLPSKILLVDDVTTSGATFLEATKELKKSGIKEVWCLALAQD